ncbi:MAG: hypothetical protein JW744_03190, partial [Candidatus Diapherotrites archaeon]|nr:hypothetical protein [Candidatus Diapherotrites archaeon]
LGEWHHIALVRYGPIIEFYLDCELDGIRTMPTSEKLEPDSEFRIGDRVDSDDGNQHKGWQGYIDAFSFRRYGMEHAEIREFCGLAYGDYFWEVEAEDSNGNSASSGIMNFRLQPNQAPTVHVLSPNEVEKFYFGQEVEINFYVEDPDDNQLTVDINLNKAAKLLFEDDFEDGNFYENPEWVVESQAGGPITIMRSAAKDGEYGLRFEGDGEGYSRIYTPIFTPYVDVFASIKTNNASDDLGGALQLRGDGSLVFGELDMHEGYFKYLCRDNPVGPKLLPLDTLPEDNKWYTFRIRYNEWVGYIEYYLYDENGFLLESHKTPKIYSRLPVDAVRLEMNRSGAEVSWDNIRVFEITDSVEVLDHTSTDSPIIECEDYDFSDLTECSFNWVVPGLVGNDFNITVQAADEVNVASDTSDEFFEITWPGFSLHLADVPVYIKEASFLSGAASIKMVTGYIRESVGYPTKTQYDLDLYARDYLLPANEGSLELDPAAIDAGLGHFDPYDLIVNDQFDEYDSLPDGNPYQGYNFSVESFSYADENALNNYMLEIAKWILYPVRKQAWWLDGELVERPNTPSIIPLYGSYGHWAVVNGFVADASPVPDPLENPWETVPVTIYGFWITDPADNGVGQHVYVTADDARSTYFRPVESPDMYCNKYVVISEPPALPPDGSLEGIDIMKSASVKIAEAEPDVANLEFVGIESAEEPAIKAIPDGVIGAAPEISTSGNEKQGWTDLVPVSLAYDQKAVSAFEQAEMSEPLLVQDLGMGQDYYLVPFERSSLTTGVIMLDAEDGHFRQASWLSVPEEFPQVSSDSAIALASESLSPEPTEGLSLEFGLAGNTEASLAWEFGEYSDSPFKPYWVIETGDGSWIATQDGKLYEISESSMSGAEIMEVEGVPPESAGFSNLGRYFEVISPDLDSGSFTAALTFFYSDSNNDGIVDGTAISEEELKAYYFDEALGWVALPNQEVDKEANAIRAVVEGFS